VNRSYDHPFLTRDDLIAEAREFEAYRARTRSAVEAAGELTEREAKSLAEAFTRYRTAADALTAAREAYHRASRELAKVPALDVLVTSSGEPRTIERAERAALAAVERQARETFESAEAEASRRQVEYTALNARVHAQAEERRRRAQNEINRRGLLANAERFGAVVEPAELERSYGQGGPNQESRALAELARRRVTGR